MSAKAADRYACALSGWRELRNVLVIRLDNIGDAVMTGPVLRALRAGLPRARLTLLASPAGSEAAPLLAPWLDELLVHWALWQDISDHVPRDPERERALVAELAARSFDAAFILTSFSQSPHPPAFVCYLAGIPVRVGQSKEFGGGVLTHWVEPLPDPTNQVERNLHLLE